MLSGQPLWYAAFLEVRRSQASTNGIVVGGVLVEVPVGGEDVLGEAAHLKKEVDQVPLNLVEALPDVSTATCDILIPEFGHFEIESREVPCILCSCGRGGASIEFWIFPPSDPRPEVHQPDGEVESVDL